MLDAAFLEKKFSQSLDYDAYLATGKPEHQEAWTKIYNQLALTDEQKTLIGGFTREMQVLVVSGTWCGDCVAQGPMLQRIAEANPGVVHLRWVDRDEHADLAERIKINQGLRVPNVLFMAEDFEFVSMLGDRTISRYRAMAAKQLAAACPLPGAPVTDEELNATTQDWLDEFERVHLLLRTSTRLRQKHGD